MVEKCNYRIRADEHWRGAGPPHWPRGGVRRSQAPDPRFAAAGRPVARGLRRPRVAGRACAQPSARPRPRVTAAGWAAGPRPSPTGWGHPSGQWPAASGQVLYDNTTGRRANQMRALAGRGSFGHRCSKHFPLDDGFLLCLAAAEGCLNFSQRQIFIHQSVQCSTGQAWEGEGETSVPWSQRGCVVFFFIFFIPPFFFPRCDLVKWDHTGGHLSSGCMCFFPQNICGHTLRMCFQKGKASWRFCLLL